MPDTGSENWISGNISIKVNKHWGFNLENQIRFDLENLNFERNVTEVKIKEDIGSSTYDWPSMNIYDLFCYVILTNITILRNSNSNYIIAHMRYLQKSNGIELLELLEKVCNVGFNKPYKTIKKHTKGKSDIGYNKIKVNPLKYKHHINIKLETEIKNLYNRMEYQFI